eukprot:TRINITY_DN8265_c0_g1_i1.p1 TRINITY_DN8265_c0_g1~~TRINITY_DN8265_c0_g1_i1.p1  ORF type:complete len:654 (-),score=198.83 TRINITY_DN8265_c0_g1_i1:142-2103(-)
MDTIRAAWGSVVSRVRPGGPAAYQRAPGLFADPGSMFNDPEKAAAIQFPKTSWGAAVKIVRSLLPYFWPKETNLRVRVVLCFMMLAGARVINIYVPMMYRNIVNDLPGSFPLSGLLMWGGLSLLQKSMEDIRSTLFQRVSQSVTREISNKTFMHVHSLSLTYHLTKRTGTLVKTIDRGTGSISMLLGILLFDLTPTILELIVVAIVLIVGYDAWLAVVAFFGTVAYITFTFLVTEWRTKFRKASNLKENEASDIVLDSLTNFEMVKYFTAEKFERGRYDKAINDYMEISMKSRLSLTFLNFGQNFIYVFCLTLSMVLTAQQIFKGKMSLGDLVAVNAYVVQLFAPLNWLGASYRMVIQGFTDIEKLFELLDAPVEIQDIPNAPHLIMPPGQSPSIEFKDVCFRYGTNPMLLTDISFTVPAGKSVALVGVSGSGKTTLFRLLCRFYEPASGSIYVDGYNINSVTQESLRKSIGVVPQDTVLFNESIEYNIAYGNRAALLEDVVAAAKSASIYNFIMGTAEQFQTRVGERGLRLSGGEKQRVAIARVLLKNPPILVLDEATSALDSHTEQEIQRALSMVSQGRTTLVIAHRLSTIVGCDEIIVLKEGRIVERGAHGELLERHGEYASLWAQQQHNTPAPDAPVALEEPAQPDLLS